VLGGEEAPSPELRGICPEMPSCGGEGEGIDMYIRSVCKKVSVKNILNFGKYKKKLTKGYTIVILFYLFNIVQNTKYFLMRIFLHTPLQYISFHIFNTIIFTT
jgi:hypothetical protein